MIQSGRAEVPMGGDDKAAGGSRRRRSDDATRSIDETRTRIVRAITLLAVGKACAPGRRVFFLGGRTASGRPLAEVCRAHRPGECKRDRFDVHHQLYTPASPAHCCILRADSVSTSCRKRAGFHVQRGMAPGDTESRRLWPSADVPGKQPGAAEPLAGDSPRASAGSGLQRKAALFVAALGAGAGVTVWCA